MSISFNVLGDVTRDNALLLLMDSGQSIKRLLFDCGEACLANISFGEVQDIDYLFFSHLHMDHIGGFDSFFRCTFNRQTKANLIWGPAQTANILQHRFQGFLWNLHTNMQGSWQVYEVLQDKIVASRFELNEAFGKKHDERVTNYKEIILDDNDFTVSAFIMNHKTDSLAYLVKEKPKINVDISKLGSLGLKPGAWIQKLKDLSLENSDIEINQKVYSLAELRKELLIETEGDSIAYLTDFLVNEQVIEQLAPKLANCKTIVCEAQYLHADLELAQKNYHMTVRYAAELARAANAKQLVLFHISDRYSKADFPKMLSEAKAIFPNTTFPDNWVI